MTIGFHADKKFSPEYDKQLTELSLTAQSEKTVGRVLGGGAGFIIGATLAGALTAVLTIGAVVGTAGLILIPIGIAALGAAIGVAIGNKLVNAKKCDEIAQLALKAKQTHNLNDLTAIITPIQEGHSLFRSKLDDIFATLSRNQLARIIHSLPDKEIKLIDNVVRARLDRDFNHKIKDADFRGCYEICMHRFNMKPDAKVLNLNFPKFTDKMKNYQVPKVTQIVNVREKDTSKIVAFDMTMLVKLSGQIPDKEITVENLDDAKVMLDFLHGNRDIEDKAKLEAIVTMAEKFGFKELLDDLKVLVINRPDLIYDEKEMQQFIKEHPSFGMLGSAHG